MPDLLDLGSPLVGDLLATCRFPEFDTGDGPLVCAVSGGADSTALLVLAVAAGHRVTAIHVDHGLRAGSSDEAGHVAELARRLGCGFRGERVIVAPGPDLEARARRARYGVLPHGVLTGHTLDDQAETILLNLMRGAGLDGLAGMDPAGEHPRRPLLALRRRDTEGLCRALGLGWITDPSNGDPAHRRNRVRHELLPLLDSIAQRDVALVIARQAGVLRAEARVLDAAAGGIDPTDASAIAGADAALARRALRTWIASSDPDGHPPDAATVERCLAVARGEARATEVGGRRRLARRTQRLSITGQERDPPPPTGPVAPIVK